MFRSDAGVRVKRALLVLASGVLVLAGAGLVYQYIATAMDHSRFPAPGELVDVGGYELHIHCLGAGVPTVVLDTMADGTSLNWAWVQPQVAEVTRSCVFDRAGRGWSESGPEPRDARHIAEELHTLLVNAGVAGRYVVGGHSFGAFTMRVFAERYSDEVSGMVIIDGGQPEIRSPRFPAEARARAGDEELFMAVAPVLARFALFRLIEPPPADLPARQREAYEAFYASTDLWSSLYAEYRALSVTDDEVLQTDGFGDRPLMVVNADTAWLTRGAPADESRRVFNAMQRELLGLSTNSEQRIVRGATHGSLVLEAQHARETGSAIIAVVEAVRSGELLGD